MFSKIINKLQSVNIQRIPYEDDFINRLRSSVIGSEMLHEGNIYLMDYAIKNMPNDGSVLEVGSWAGLSTNLLLHLIKKYQRNNTFYNCDPWVYEGYYDNKGIIEHSIDGRSDIARETYMEYIRQAYINAMLLFHKTCLPHTFRLTSDAFFNALQKKVEMTDIVSTKNPITN